MMFLGLFTTLLVAGLVDASSVQILDENDKLAIGNIVQEVCSHAKGYKSQISKISTVVEVAEYLSSLPDNHKLASCKSSYLNSARDLAHLVSTGNENVCSQQKIAEIQHFHQSYILKGSQRKGDVAKVLLAFYYHYMHSVSDVCAIETASLLNAINNSEKTEDDEFLAEIATKMGISTSSELEYKDMYLVWSLVDMLSLQGHNKLEKYLQQGPKRLVMAMKDPKEFHLLQEFCAAEPRPLYSLSLLASIKLIEMGYYPPDARVLDALNHQSREGRKLFDMTVICEAVLPIQAIDQTSESGKILMTRQEVENLGLTITVPLSEVTEEVCKGCMLEVDVLPSVNSADAIPVAKRVKNDIKGRKSAMSRLVKLFFRNIKDNIVASMKKLFGEEVPEDIKGIDETQLDIYEVFDDDEESGSESGVARPKRGIKSILSNIGKKIGVKLLILAAILWSIVAVVIFLPLYYLYKGVSHITGWKSPALREFLYTGGANLLYGAKDWKEEMKKEK